VNKNEAEGLERLNRCANLIEHVGGSISSGAAAAKEGRDAIYDHHDGDANVSEIIITGAQPHALQRCNQLQHIRRFEHDNSAQNIFEIDIATEIPRSPFSAFDDAIGVEFQVCIEPKYSAL
jgi:hypothetical protein